MRLARFKVEGKIKNGIVEKDKVIELYGDLFGGYELNEKEHLLTEVKLLSPVEPTKIIAVGLNYTDHAKELKMTSPEEPLLFMKPSTSVIGPEEMIICPVMSKQVDYEAELGVVIKDVTKNVGVEEARDHVLGFTCANDVTARDLQNKDGQWTRCKGFDTFSPLGPWIVTDLDPLKLTIESYLNGELKQSSNTDNMVFDVYQLLSFISKVMTLLPGDIIMTGTPYGVGPMQAGDTIEIVIEGIGSLRNRVGYAQEV